MWGKPTLETWQLRNTWVISVHPIPAFAKGYCYARRVLYIDEESYLSEWADLYDANNVLWKADYDPQGMVQVPGVSAAWNNDGWGSIYDLQNSHMSLGVLGVWHANEDCKNLHGVDYTSFAHFFTLSALARIMR